MFGLIPDRHRYCTYLYYYAALEDKILAFFTQRATLALSNVRHLQDPTDPTSLALDAESHADFLARLRFSTHILTDNQVRRLSDQ